MSIVSIHLCPAGGGVEDPDSEACYSIATEGASIIIMDARSAMRPCYILPMFFIYFLFPPYLAKRLNGSSRNFHTW